MSALESLQDDWLGEDERDLLDALGELFDEIAGSALPAGGQAAGDKAALRLDSLREQGWYEFATDEGTSTLLYAEAVKRLHRRLPPVQAPIFEALAALRVLSAATDPAAEELLSAAQSGERGIVLDFASLFAPRAPGSAGGAVPFGDTFTALVVVDDGSDLALHVVEPSGADAESTALVDPTLPSFRTRGTGERVSAIPREKWEVAAAETLVVQANALVGQSQALLDSTLQFLTVREQFGVPISSFQALRHRAADVASDLYAAQQLSIHIAETFDDGADRWQLGLLGKSLCGRAAVKASSEAVQLRGGMGFTWEDGTHFGLKRIMGLALTGPSVEDAERELGSAVIETGRPRWAGGLNNAQGVVEQ